MCLSAPSFPSSALLSAGCLANSSTALLQAIDSALNDQTAVVSSPDVLALTEIWISSNNAWLRGLGSSVGVLGPSRIRADGKLLLRGVGASTGSFLRGHCAALLRTDYLKAKRRCGLRIGYFCAGA